MLRKYFTGAICVALVLLNGCGPQPDLSVGSDKLTIGDSADSVVELCGNSDSQTEPGIGQEWHYSSVVQDASGAGARLKVRVVIKNGRIVALSKSRSPVK